MLHHPAGSDGSLDELVAEHRAIDRRLQEIEGQRYLSPEDELEVQRLKKLKLAKKDQIELLRQRVRVN